MSSAVRHCSFCGKSQDDVRKLAFSTDASICDECVILCVDVFCDPDGPKDISDDIGNLPPATDAALAGGEEFDPDWYRDLINGQAVRVDFEPVNHRLPLKASWEGFDPSKGRIVPLAPSIPPLSTEDVRAIVREKMDAERARQVPFVMGPPLGSPGDAE